MNKRTNRYMNQTRLCIISIIQNSSPTNPLDVNPHIDRGLSSITPPKFNSSSLKNDGTGRRSFSGATVDGRDSGWLKPYYK